MDTEQQRSPADASPEGPLPAGDRAHLASRVLTGIGASPGIAVGPALVYRSPGTGGPAATKTAAPVDPKHERERLAPAIARAAEELRALAMRVASEIGPAEAGIFEAQALMIEDPTLAERAGALIERAGVDAAAAFAAGAEEQAAQFTALSDPLWQARAMDVRDAAARVVAQLQPDGARAPSVAQALAAFGAPAILVAADLAPSSAVALRGRQVLGVALAEGSAAAHAAILARALGLPAVLGLGHALLEAVRSGETLVLNGTEGSVVVRPAAAEQARAQQEVDQQQRARAIAHDRQARRGPQLGRTADGRLVPLLANVGSETDARAAAEVGAEGIGLLRTEFLFAARATLPSEQEQAELYAGVIRALGPTRGPIVVRTLDVGADKPLPALAPLMTMLPAEQNPALGVRGIRLQMAAAELLDVQLRALLAATARTRANVQVLLPMIATVEEVRAVRTRLRTAREALARRGVHLDRTVPLGIMVETPAAVFSIEHLAREAAFFSIGTNDLTQYVLAADRINPRLAELYQPLQPAVLRAIAMVTQGAHRAGHRVTVCGEMAGDARLGPLLVGLGVDELSMTPGNIPAVREALARQTVEKLRALAERALRAATLADARQALDELAE